MTKEPIYVRNRYVIDGGPFGLLFFSEQNQSRESRAFAVFCGMVHTMRWAVVKSELKIPSSDEEKEAETHKLYNELDHLLKEHKNYNPYLERGTLYLGGWDNDYIRMEGLQPLLRSAALSCEEVTSKEREEDPPGALALADEDCEECAGYGYDLFDTGGANGHAVSEIEANDGCSCLAARFPDETKEGESFVDDNLAACAFVRDLEHGRPRAIGFAELLCGTTDKDKRIEMLEGLLVVNPTTCARDNEHIFCHGARNGKPVVTCIVCSRSPEQVAETVKDDEVDSPPEKL